MRDIYNPTVVAQQVLAGGTHHHYYGSGEPQRVSQVSSSASTSGITQEKLSAEKLSDLRVQLNNFYAQQAQIKYLFYNLDPIPISHVPRLALVLEREQTNIELEKILRKGLSVKDNAETTHDERINSFEDHYKERVPIDLQKIFDEGNSPSNRILILGRAGVGKTTLCQYIAYQRSQGKLWQDRFEWVFWISLRNLRRKYYADPEKKEITLAEVVYQECFKHSTIVTLEDVKRLLVGNPKILWLLDGYDEISALDKEDTPIGHLLKILLFSELVILTSRPYAIPDNVKGYRRLENIGFLNEDIEDYVKKFFAAIGHPNRARDFLAFIKQNPLLWGSAHIPIVLELICCVWNGRRNQGVVLDKQLSMTELYSELVLKLCKRYLEERNQSPIKKEEVRKLKSPPVLEECEGVLQFLGELAYKASRRSESSILIDNDLIQELVGKYDSDNSTLFKDVLDAGFLKNTGEARDAIDQEAYFIHLTFQEYFTAYHIVQKLKQNDPLIIEFIKQNKYTRPLEVTWWFVAGLLKNDNQTLEKFFDILENEPKDLSNLYHQMLLMRCVNEAHLALPDQKITAFTAEFSGWLDFGKLAKNVIAKNIIKHFLLCPFIFRRREVLEKFTSLIKDKRTVAVVIEIFASQVNLPTEIIEAFGGFLPHNAGQNLSEVQKSILKILNLQSTLPPSIAERMHSLQSLRVGVSSQQYEVNNDTLTQAVATLEKSSEDQSPCEQQLLILSKQKKIPEGLVLRLVECLPMKKNFSNEYLRPHIAIILADQDILPESARHRLVDLLSKSNGFQMSGNPISSILGQQKIFSKEILISLEKLLFRENLGLVTALALAGQTALEPPIHDRLFELLKENIDDYCNDADPEGVCQQVMMWIPRIIGRQTLLPGNTEKLAQLLQHPNCEVNLCAIYALVNQERLAGPVLMQYFMVLQKPSVVELLEKENPSSVVEYLKKIISHQPFDYLLSLLNPNNERRIDKELLKIFIMKILLNNIPIYREKTSLFFGNKERHISFNSENDCTQYVNTFNEVLIEMNQIELPLIASLTKELEQTEAQEIGLEM